MSHLLAFIMGYFAGKPDKNEEPKSPEEVERENEFWLFVHLAIAPFIAYFLAMPFLSSDPVVKTILKISLIIYMIAIFIKILWLFFRENNHSKK